MLSPGACLEGSVDKLKNDVNISRNAEIYIEENTIFLCPLNTATLWNAGVPESSFEYKPFVVTGNLAEEEYCHTWLVILHQAPEENSTLPQTESTSEIK